MYGKYLQNVNPLMGTDSRRRYSRGNTLPLVQMPWAMAAFVPQTDSSRGNWFFHPADRSLEGIRCTHLASPWMKDYGFFCMLPQGEDACFIPEERWSCCDPQQTELTPYSLRVDFSRYRAELSLVPSDRGALIRIRYREPSEWMRFTLVTQGEASFSLSDGDHPRLCGSVRRQTEDAPENFTLYFMLEWDRAYDPDLTVRYDGADGRHGISLAFRRQGPGSMQEIRARLAISYLGFSFAEHSLETEIRTWDLGEQEKLAARRWENLLSRIEIEAPPDIERTFYSCFYRACLYPHKCYERDAHGSPYHISMQDGSVRQGILYTDNGFWDTYRTVYPLYSILFPKRYGRILRGYLNFCQDTGWLPKWPAPAETGIMTGTLIDAVLADAAVKGILRGSDLQEAYGHMKAQADISDESTRSGRTGLRDYLHYGYLPDDLRESVTGTLDYTYGDFCVAQVAHLLGCSEEEKRYRERASWYRNLFDPQSLFFRGKNRAGKFEPSFSPFRWGSAYCEGSAWQYRFHVCYDLTGLCHLYGGKERLLHQLDALFNSPTVYEVGSYQGEIHEMTEMALADLGQCAVSNQPSFEIPYLYAALGEKGKSDFWIRRIVAEQFSSRADGYPGDEDNGSLSAWYLFSVLGFYPFCPGKAEYVKTTPIATHGIIHTGCGDFDIDKPTARELVLNHSEICGGD